MITSLLTPYRKNNTVPWASFIKGVTASTGGAEVKRLPEIRFRETCRLTPQIVTSTRSKVDTNTWDQK